MKPEKKKEIIRTCKYFVFASSAGVIEIGSFTLLEKLTSWNYWPCYLIALVLSVLWNFTLNRTFTFRASNNISIAMLKVAAYYAVFTPVSTVLGNYLAETMMLNAYFVTILNIACNGITEYLYQRLFVFGSSIDTNQLAAKKVSEVHS